MGNINSFSSYLSEMIFWLKRSSKNEDKSAPKLVGCTSVREFLQEYEQDFNFFAGPFALKYPCCEGYILQKFILQLEKERNEGFAFLAKDQVIFENLTLFHVVCLAKDSLLVGKYLNEGVQVNQEIDAVYRGEYKGCSPLHLALFELQTSKNDNEEKFLTIAVLLFHGADVNKKNSQGNAPLHVLFSLGGPLDQRLYDLILDFGADDNATNKRGETGFEVFLLTSHDLLDIEAYIENGGNINHFNSMSNKGCIAMMMMNNRVSVKAISNSSNIMQADTKGRTALHNVVSFEPTDRKDASYIEFIQHKLPKLIESLLKMGGNIDCQDNSGKTPLHYAVDFQNGLTVSLLLRFGSDINITNAAGKSALASNLSFSKSTMNVQQINQNNSILNTLIVYMNNLEEKGRFISKHNKKERKKAQKLIPIMDQSFSRF